MHPLSRPIFDGFLFFTLLLLFLAGENSAAPTTITSSLFRKDTSKRDIPHKISFQHFELSSRNRITRRGCFQSKDGEVCDGQVPSVADIVTEIGSWGKVATHISIFYNGLNAANGVATSKAWAGCQPDIGTNFVMFDDIVSPDFVTDNGAAIMQVGGGAALDSFQKRMSQAFAEASKGTVFFLTPEGNTPPLTSAWGGWEFPALTRNPNVDKVVQVDPSTNVRNTIWTQGDPPTDNQPGG